MLKFDCAHETAPDQTWARPPSTKTSPPVMNDRKSLLALRGVGSESEAESVRFHERRVTKVGPEVKLGFFGLRAPPATRKSCRRRAGTAEQGVREGLPHLLDQLAPLLELAKLDHAWDRAGKSVFRLVSRASAR
jgi:hypothetical protein